MIILRPVSGTKEREWGSAGRGSSPGDLADYDLYGRDYYGSEQTSITGGNPRELFRWYKKAT